MSLGRFARWTALCCCALLLAGSQHGLAYTVEDGDNLTETETCNRFVVRPGGENFQMRAYPVDNASAGDSEWYTATDVSRVCETRVDRAFNQFYELLTSYPTRVKYSFTLKPSTHPQTEKEQYRLTVLSSWGDLTDPAVRAECDYEGNAYFVAPSGLMGTGDFVPQSVASMDWKPSEEKTFEDQFDLELKGDTDPAPIFGEGFLLVPVLCRVRPSPDNASQIVWPARPLRFLVHVSAEIRHWWGLLHPEMWSELVLMSIILVPKFLLVVWFFFRCRMFRDHVMTQQRYFLWISFFSFLATFAFTMFLVSANNNGFNTCCPTPASSAFFLGLKVMSNIAFNLLVLATAKGWGVVNPKLSPDDQRKITMFFMVTLIIYILSRVLKPNFALVYLQVINETSVWMWIGISLKHTTIGLNQSARPDRHAKLEMYARLRKLLVLCLILWSLIVTSIVWVILIVYNQQGRLIIYDIPPTLAWDVTLLVMMSGFGWIWRPCPATAQFSYTFARQEEEGIDARDPVSEFGLETSN